MAALSPAKDNHMDIVIYMANHNPVSSAAMSMDLQVSQVQATEDLLNMIRGQNACHITHMQGLAQQVTIGIATFNLGEENLGITFGKWNSRPINKAQAGRLVKDFNRLGLQVTNPAYII